MSDTIGDKLHSAAAAAITKGATMRTIYPESCMTTDIITPEQIAELERLGKAATPGPWTASDTSIITDEYCIAVIEDDGGYESPNGEDNQALIIALRNALPALLSTLKAQSAAIEALRPVVKLTVGPVRNREAQWIASVLDAAAAGRAALGQTGGKHE